MSPNNRVVTLAALTAVLLALGCRENQVVDPNVTPAARAEVDGEDAVMPGIYEIALDDPSDTVELTLDGSASDDGDGEIVDYVWISGTLDPEGSGARFIPDGEEADWPDDGRTTDVELGEGLWHFHLYVTDDEGAVSSPATLQITVGDPPPIAAPGAGSGDGDGGGGASPAECVEAASAVVSASCAECTCNNGGTCAADVAACNETCWGLINCVGTECGGDGTDTACIVAGCMAFLGEAASATAAGPCAAACTAECAE